MRARALSLLLSLAACGHDGGSDAHGHEAGGHDGHASAGGHSHDPRHGGVLIELGDEYAHVEVALEPESGRVRAWLYDREVRPVRSSAASLVLSVDGGEALELKAVANPLTGETVGDASCFEASAPELVGAGELQGTLETVDVLGREFEAVRVRWVDVE